MADSINLVHNRIFFFLFHNRFPFKGDNAPFQKSPV